MAVTELVPVWVQEVSMSYDGDTWAQEQVKRLRDNSGYDYLYTEHHGILRYKGRVYIGTGGNVRERVLLPLC